MRNTDGLAHDRAPERDALALTARELPGLAIEEALEVEDLRRRPSTALSMSAFGVLRSCRPKAMLSRTLMCG